jgi:hypothetical protein
MANIVAHTIYEETNIKNIWIMLSWHIVFQPQYVAPETYVAGHNISLGWKLLCI